MRSLRLAWSGPPEFSAGYQLETSDDLRQWRRVGGGQLLSLQSPSGPLTQPVVPLPERAGRFARLVWTEPATAPALPEAGARRHDGQPAAGAKPGPLLLRERGASVACSCPRSPARPP